MKRSKKKYHKNKKLTIVKILPKDGTITRDDLEKWHEIFKTKSMTPTEAEATGEVVVENLPLPKPNQHFITLVKVGNDDYKPTAEDLEQWRQVFEAAANDPDYTVFTHHAVNVEVIDLNKILLVE